MSCELEIQVASTVQNGYLYYQGRGQGQWPEVSVSWGPKVITKVTGFCATNIPIPLGGGGHKIVYHKDWLYQIQYSTHNNLDRLSDV